jgi:N utilization substance protein B
LDKITDLNIEQDDREFVVELFQYTMDRQDEFSTLVEPKLENWDMERIAILDLIIMKMALCELLYFPMIPVKVTINEYIEIAKLYSTPKSKDFVNGVLDKIMKELKESGAIKKSGRGLQG